MTTFSTSRVFFASPAEIFAAIQSPDRLARWWGPNGFSNRFEVFEFQAGGRWVFEMMGPDGKRYPNECLFSTIEPEKRVVVQHVCEPYFQLTITLEPAGTGTLLRWDQAFDDDAAAQAIRHIVEPANEQNLDRLSAELSR